VNRWPSLREIRTEVDCEFYAIKTLGAYGSDLAMISWFFQKPYETPIAALSATNQSWVLNVASQCLGAQARFVEALPAMRTVLRLRKQSGSWKNAAIAASNLSLAELLVGEVAAAVKTAEESIAYANQSGDEFRIVADSAVYAGVLHAAGRSEKAGRQFSDAERRQKKRAPYYPLLYSSQGYQYCDLLLAKGENGIALERASRTLKWAISDNLLLDIAVDKLTIGRAHLRIALEDVILQRATTHEDTNTSRTWLGEAVDGLHAAGQLGEVPLGLLARAAFRRCVGDWDRVARDLDEVEQIAEPGPMRLFLCDMALERARLALARVEAFAPLNGLIDDGPPKPVLPDEAEAARLTDEARANVAKADRLITECGYHRRDEELAELQAVLKGERTFADLPPRV
jgi:tetratricopeptide (TPR) repeat protein